jgi:hypothetical protein
MYTYMSAKLLLRIAALLMLIHVLGHSVGMATWRKADDPVRMEVVRQMNEHSFPFMPSGMLQHSLCY